MAIIHDAKDQFYSYAKEFLGAELEQLLDSDDKKDEFYSLCKKFSEILLNAPKFKDPKTGILKPVKWKVAFNTMIWIPQKKRLWNL